MVKAILDQLLEHLDRYYSVYRGPYVPSRTSQLSAEPGSEILRECLADHIGTLPIVATFLYSHLTQATDLGRTLHMLAVHDIGETKVGDVLTVVREKTNQEITAEQTAALDQLDTIHHSTFEEFEANQSNEAKFAHSVDKITPNLYEFLIPVELATERHSHFGFNIVQAVEKDRDLMEWDAFLLNFYDELIQRTKDRFKN